MLALRLVIAAIAVSALLADERTVDADPDVDFSRFRTFAIRQGNINSRKPELNSPLVRQRIEAAIRSELTAKGLSEDQSRPDLVVNFRLGASDQREVQLSPAGPLGRRTRATTYTFTEGTLVIDLLQRDGQELVWRGIYTDAEKDAGKLSRKLTEDVKKLFEEYPPKKN